MNILELCTFSAGADGVWKRVIKESEILSKRHKVVIFSSNLTKGSDTIASAKENFNGFEVRRFPALKPGNGKLRFLPGGESFMFWNFEKEAIKFSPNIIIAHVYRHTHTLKAIKIAKKIRKQGKECKVFLVTHAPFGREKSRSRISNLVVRFYDQVIGKRTINNFDKIITISKWETRYLESLGLNKNKIVFIPNWIDSEFFNSAKSKERIIFLGRISPIKNIETIILTAKTLPSEKFIILGPAEKEYLDKLNLLIKRHNIFNIELIDKTYNITEQKDLLDSSDIFILPSKTEGHPQSLLEAMARGKIVIASDNLSSREIISNGKDGFIFPFGDYLTCSEIIKKIRSSPKTKINQISRGAVDRASIFKKEKLISKLEKTIK